MAVSGNSLTFNVLDTSGAVKQLTCSVNNGHALTSTACGVWTPLPATP